MAEFVVKKNKSWMEALTPKERESKGITEKYNRRTMPGDIISVHPDGHIYGKKEKTELTIVKRPDISFEDALKYLVRDFEVYAIAEPRIIDLVSKSEISTLKTIHTDKEELSEAIITVFETKKAQIKNIAIKRQSDNVKIGDMKLDGKFLVYERGAEDGISVDLEAETETETFPVHKLLKSHRFHKRRYKIENNKVVDKITNEIVE